MTPTQELERRDVLETLCAMLISDLERVSLNHVVEFDADEPGQLFDQVESGSGGLALVARSQLSRTTTGAAALKRVDELRN